MVVRWWVTPDALLTQNVDAASHTSYHPVEFQSHYPKNYHSEEAEPPPTWYVIEAGRDLDEPESDWFRRVVDVPRLENRESRFC